MTTMGPTQYGTGFQTPQPPPPPGGFPGRPGMPPGGPPEVAGMVPYSGGPKTVEMLRQTRPWVLFLSILGFIGAALMCMAGLAGALGGVAVGDANLMVMIIYVPLSLFYIMPSIFLYRYASRIQDFVQAQLQPSLDSALEAQKSFWRYTGILTLIGLVLYVGIIVLAIVLAVVLPSFA